MAKSKLKPCPFCGSEKHYWIDHRRDCYLRMLDKLRTNIDAYTQKEMDRAWNRRSK